MSVQGKYMKGVTLSFTAKLTFYLNDRPKWAEVSAAFPKKNLWLTPWLLSLWLTL